jgi:hypothetical protein
MAPEVVLGVAEGVGVTVGVAALDVVAGAVVVGLTEVEVVIVRLDGLDEEDTTAALLLAGFEDVYSYDQYLLAINL